MRSDMKAADLGAQRSQRRFNDLAFNALYIHVDQIDHLFRLLDVANRCGGAACCLTASAERDAVVRVSSLLARGTLHSVKSSALPMLEPARTSAKIGTVAGNTAIVRSPGGSFPVESRAPTLASRDSIMHPVP
jgi:hypothetical protein